MPLVSTAFSCAPRRNLVRKQAGWKVSRRSISVTLVAPPQATISLQAMEDAPITRRFMLVAQADRDRTSAGVLPHTP